MTELIHKFRYFLSAYVNIRYLFFVCYYFIFMYYTM